MPTFVFGDEAMEKARRAVWSSLTEQVIDRVSAAMMNLSMIAPQERRDYIFNVMDAGALLTFRNLMNEHVKSLYYARRHAREITRPVVIVFNGNRRSSFELVWNNQ